MADKILRTFKGHAFDEPVQPWEEVWTGAISVPSFPPGSPEREEQRGLLAAMGNGPYRIVQFDDGRDPELRFDGRNETICQVLIESGYRLV